jgi:RnfABCDGE-type electron transport complex G subunit
MTAQSNKDDRSDLVRKILVYAGVLMGVCLASGAGISSLYVANTDRIRRNEQRSFRQTLAVVLGDAGDARPIADEQMQEPARMYQAALNGTTRYVARGSAQGYQSNITVLVSVDAPEGRPLPDDPVIHRVAVVSSGETPGLGENINKVKKDVSLWAALMGMEGEAGEDRPAFQAQFSGKRLSDLQVDKSGKGGITPVTGATITSRATTAAVREAVTALIRRTRRLHTEK